MEESCGYLSTHNLRPTSAAADLQAGLRVVVDTLRARRGGAPAIIRLRMRSKMMEGAGVQQALQNLGVQHIVDDLEPFMIRPNGELWLLRNLFDLVRLAMGTLHRPDDSLLRFEIMWWAHFENWTLGSDGLSARERLFDLQDARLMYGYRTPVVTIVRGAIRRAEFLSYNRDYNGCIVLVDDAVEFVMQ